MNEEPDGHSKSITARQIQALEEFVAAFDSPAAAAAALQKYASMPPTIRRPDAGARPKPGPVLLRASGLRKTYKRGRQKINVLNGIDLQIHQGEFVAITGASGSGKSTLLQLLGGLDRPSEGEVAYDDVSLARLSDKKLSQFRSSTVGFVFQFFYLQPFLSLSRNLEVANMFARKPRRSRAGQITTLAEKVGLSDRLEHLPKELSGGQMQRAAIARALMNQPKIILADEPTGNLDSVNSASIIDLFESIRSEFGTTIVIVTHDLDIARRADREIIIKDGLVV